MKSGTTRWGCVSRTLSVPGTNGLRPLRASIRCITCFRLGAATPYPLATVPFRLIDTVVQGWRLTDGTRGAHAVSFRRWLVSAPEFRTVEPTNREAPAQDLPGNLLDRCADDLKIVWNKRGELANLLWSTDPGLQGVENVFEAVVYVVELEHGLGHDQLDVNLKPVGL